jgi:chromosome segregation ATPase
MTTPLDHARQAVTTSEQRLANLSTRLATARVEARKLDASMADAPDIDSTVEALARARSRIEVLHDAERAEQERLSLYRRELADAQAKDAQAEAARLFKDYQKQETVIRTALGEVVTQLMPQGQELARLGAAVFDAARRGGNVQVYAVHADPTLAGRMIGALAADAITKAFLAQARSAVKASA